MTESEFLDIYREQAPIVFRFCAFRTGSAQEAEDITAEAFSRLLARSSQVHPGKRVAWLHAVARNLCADYGRRRRCEPLEGVEAPVAEVDSVWLDDEVRDAVAKLSPRSQQVLFLRAIEDLPFERVAALLGTNAASARMRYHRAVAKVRKQLEVRACPNAETS